MLALKVKIKLDQNQELKLWTLSNEHRLLYNHLLGHLKESGKSDFVELNQCYKNYRNENKLTISSKSAQNTCRNLITAIKSFYALRKKDKTARFPYKFKSWKHFFSFMYDRNGEHAEFRIENNQLILNLTDGRLPNQKYLIVDLPNICSKINMKNVKLFTFSQDEISKDYYISFVYSEKKNSNQKTKSKELLKIEDGIIAIDLGYSQIITAFSNKIPNYSIENLKLRKLQTGIEKVQSNQDKHHKKGSRRYRKLNKAFKRLKRKQANKLKDFHHKTSKSFVDICKENNINSVIIGDLKVKQVNKTENHKINGLSKSTGIGRFKTFLKYKLENANIGFYLVNEYNSSKRNCLTGKIELNSELSNRTVFLNESIMIDRDLNSAINHATKKMGKCITQFLIQSNKFELRKMYYDTHKGCLCMK